MRLKEIIDFIDRKIPPSLALKSDEVGFKKYYDLDEDITSIKVYMDFLPEDDLDYENTLIITHHPPLFIPETPTYTIHSNWDIISGGANDALADTFNLEVIDCLDSNTQIGRICKSNKTFGDFKKTILNYFRDVRIVNDLDDEKPINRVGIISGFGLKNPEHILLSKEQNLDILVSGDLTQETAILAKYLDITLIDLGHHESEVPGLHALKEILEELDINIGIVDKKPIEKLR